MSERTITRMEYESGLQAVYLAASLLAQHDLPAMLAAITRADSIGAILDPTLYRDRQKAMHEDQEAINAALRLAALGRKLAGG